MCIPTGRDPALRWSNPARQFAAQAGEMAQSRFQAAPEFPGKSSRIRRGFAG
jgi:hypothetical protein